MADQKINALPTKTTPTSGDKCLMSGAAEEYLIDYDKLATAILNKLTSKTFTLDQGTKTLIAAINELNSKISRKIMTYSKVFGFANAKEIKITISSVNLLYGSILVCTNQNSMDYITVSGKDNIEIKHMSSDNINTTCVYDEASKTLSIKFITAYYHGFAIVGGTLANDDTNIYQA